MGSLKRTYREARSVAGRLVAELDHRVSAARHRRARKSLLVHDDGPGGPLLVVVGDGDDFSRFYVEILRAEGANCFTVVPAKSLNEEVLRSHELVLLSSITTTPDQVALLTRWLNQGGRIVAMRPVPELAHLFGLQPTGHTIEEGYIKVETTRSPGRGVSDRAMQFHGVADVHQVVDCTVIAELLESADNPASCPAVVVRQLEDGRGCAAAFTYDLARSVVQTRQGNPAWVGQNRDGDLLNRSDDLFFGAAVGDEQRDWVDPELLDLPQADEQQRLLMNVLAHMCADRIVLPRFWYLPDRRAAAIVMTGDDHALNGTAERFQDYRDLDVITAESRAWNKVRATSYVYAHSPMTDADALELEKQGFEISLHLTTKGTEYDLGSLNRAYRRQMKLFRSRYPSVSPPSTHRTHCVVWSDWTTQAEVERAHGIRLDTNYYFYPAPWVAGRIGLFTGSGIPMRFASARGEIIDCYQVATQLNDETGQIFPETIEKALDQALSDVGRATVLTANMHTDLGASSGSDAIVGEARRRGVAVISARQLLEWLDGRSGSCFQRLELRGDVLSFEIAVGDGAQGLTVVVPIPSDSNSVSSVSKAGIAIPFEEVELWGSHHVVFAASGGSHEIHFSKERAVSEASNKVAAATGVREVVNLPIEAGHHDSTVITSARGGALILNPGLFLDPTLRIGLNRWTGADQLVPMHGDAEVYFLGKGTVRSIEPLPAGSSLEAEVCFSGRSGERVGFLSPDSADTSIAFTVDDVGGVSAVVCANGDRLAVDVPGDWCGALHRFRIDWDEGLTLFAIDGRTIAEHRAQMRDPLYPAVSVPVGIDGEAPRLGVRWLRTSDFPLEGTFTSEAIDLGFSSTWGHARLRSPALTMTGARAAFRAGETEEPGYSWSDWVDPGASGTPLVIKGRFLQYRVKLLTASPRWTPEVLGVSIERLR